MDSDRKTPQEKAAAKTAAPTPPWATSAAEEPTLIVSSSPHARVEESIESVMYTVVLALVPALAGAVVFFGLAAVRVVLWSVAACLFFEVACLAVSGGGRAGLARRGRAFLAWARRAIGSKKAPQEPEPRWLIWIGVAAGDGSAFVTGLLLAMNLPSSAPWWLVVAGACVAMVLAKHVFGGLGANPFNPALVARVFLLIAWPVRMTHWPIPRFASHLAAPDAVTAATPLGVLKTDGLDAMLAQFPLRDLFLGNIGGSLGETSALLLLVGGAFLIARRIIRWQIPVAYVGSFFILSSVAWWIDPYTMASPVYHLLAGGLLLGAFFMATDYVTSPLAPRGMLIFGVGCGVLTFVIRFFCGYPEGVSFAILIMNALVPLIDRYCVGKPVAYVSNGGRPTRTK